MILIVALGAARVGRAQDHAATVDWPARVSALERRDHRHPGDTGVLCELGWAYYQSRAPAPAAGVLDRAIALLGAPQTPALTRRLAACLFSRGRVAEQTDVAAAIPFYERSAQLRTDATTATRLDGARRVVAARWTHETITTSPPADRAAAGGAAVVLDRYASAAGDEIQVLLMNDTRDIVVVARRARGAWAREAAWGGDDPECQSDACGPGSSWLEAPMAAGELARIVVVYALHERAVIGAGPYLWATLAIDVSGSVRVVSRDEHGRSV